jgi:hypothetical protein
MDMDHDLCVRAWLPFATTGDRAVWTESMPGFDFTLKIETGQTVSLTEAAAIRSCRWNLPASATLCLVLSTSCRRQCY